MNAFHAKCDFKTQDRAADVDYNLDDEDRSRCEDKEAATNASSYQSPTEKDKKTPIYYIAIFLFTCFNSCPDQHFRHSAHLGGYVVSLHRRKVCTVVPRRPYYCMKTS